MKFNWQRFCEEKGVAYEAEGPNVARGNINIRCPFCDDPSEHLGLSLLERAPKWGCWRCRTAGLTPNYLVGRLLHCSRAQADVEVAAHDDRTPDDFDSLLDPPRAGVKTPLQREKMLPAGLHPLDNGRASARPFLEYLKERGFDQPDYVAAYYHLHYAIVGDYARRVVLPVYMERQLISWVGRAVQPATIRYKTEDSGDLKRTVANWDRLQEESGDELLLISEGPFDFLKLDHFGKLHDIRATCTFGTSYTQAQVALLVKLVRKFRKSIVVFDAEAKMMGARLADELSEISGKRVDNRTVKGVKDPGEMTRRGIVQFTGL